MDLDEIRAFVAVADSGSVNAAARRLHLAQPTVTRQIQRLERSLGGALLDRRTKPLTLTAAGRVVLEHCRQVLRAVDHLEAAVADGPAGELRVGVSQTLSEIALAGPVDRIRRASARVALSITTGWSHELVDGVRSGRLDAAFVLLPDGTGPPAGLRAERLGTEGLVIVAPRRAPGPALREVGALAREPWVLNPAGCGFRAALQRAFDAIHESPRVAVEVYGTELHLSLVARGVGLGVVPARALARSRWRPRVRVVRVREATLSMGVWLVHAPLPERLEPAVAVLREALRAVYARS